jgi:post-segregation antitoxin (ccd killing protein)
MSNDKPLRSLTVQIANWFPVSWDVGRDPVLADIEDESQVLPSIGMHICGVALCLAKDDDWVSRNEVLRIGIPGTRESKLAAAAALCEVNMWREEEREGVAGWTLGLGDLLDGKRKRHKQAKDAADARYGRSAKPKPVVAPISEEEESPF